VIGVLNREVREKKTDKFTVKTRVVYGNENGNGGMRE